MGHKGSLWSARNVLYLDLRGYAWVYLLGRVYVKSHLKFT